MEKAAVAQLNPVERASKENERSKARTCAAVLGSTGIEVHVGTAVGQE